MFNTHKFIVISALSSTLLQPQVRAESSTVLKVAVGAVGVYVAYSYIKPDSLEAVISKTGKACKVIYWRWQDLFTAFDKHNVNHALKVTARVGSTFECRTTALVWQYVLGSSHEWMSGWCKEHAPLLRGCALLEQDIVTLRGYKQALEARVGGMTSYDSYETLNLCLQKMEESLIVLISTPAYVQQTMRYNAHTTNL